MTLNSCFQSNTLNSNLIFQQQMISFGIIAVVGIFTLKGNFKLFINMKLFVTVVK